MKKTLEQWLTEECDAFDVRPLKVTIGKESWEACYYKQHNEYQPGMDAVSRGEKKAGDTYEIEAIYCLGELPKPYKQSSRLCFPLDGVEWYVAGYILKENMTPSNAEFHPFGVTFTICPWKLESGGKIDKYEAKPYKRIKLVLA